MRMNLALTVLIAALYTLPAFGQQATREDFNEFTKASVGRWIGQITWIADWPGIGKKGDKATCYAENKISEDGNALISKSFGGNGSGTSITMYDAGAKQIRESGVDSGGSVWTAIYFKEGGKWASTSTGSLADGSKVEGKALATYTDDGNTVTFTGTVTINGKKADDLHDVYRRVSK